MAFPDSRLDVGIEMAFGADLGSSPLEWTWTDVSDRRQSHTIRHTRGASSERGDTNPSSVPFELDNSDAELTPENSSSSWYPDVHEGVPIRFWVEGATPGLVLPGVAGAYCSTPDHDDFDFAGDFDLRMKVTPDQWTDAHNRSQVLWSKYGASGQRSWRWQLAPTGNTGFTYSLDGTSVSVTGGSGEFAGRIAAVRALSIGVTYDSDNGGADGTYKFYAWTGTGSAPADVTTWDFVGTTGDSGAGPGALFASTAPLELGTVNGGDQVSASVRRFRGVIHEVQVRDGINGTIVADPDFAAADPGDTTVTDSTGKVWTVHGAAAITTRRIRSCGTMDELSIVWPKGDNEAGNAAQESECWAEITAAGILRRLDQGTKPIKSPIYRKVTNNGAQVFLWGYWPVEVGEGAVRAASALPGDSELTLAGFSGTDDTLPGSESLPTIQPGQTGSVTGPITDFSFFDNWAVTFLFRMTNPDSTYRRIMAIETDGTAARWEILYSSTGFRTRAVNGSETELFSSDETAPFPGAPDWYVVYLEVRQSGGDMRWDLEAVPILRTSGATATDSGTESGTVGKPTAVNNASVTTAAESTLALGHIAIHDRFDPNWATGWLNSAANAHIGETAAARFARLCTEQGIASEIVGDYLIDPLGDITLSEVMGAQQAGPFLDVLSECVKIDQGRLISRRATPGLVYRTRLDLEAQASVGLALDGEAEGFRPGLRATYDDKGYRNEITVNADLGSEATARDNDAITARELYDEQITVNGVGGINLGVAASTRPSIVSLVDSQLGVLAARRLHIGTWPDPRIRRATTELSIAPGLIPAWHDLAEGDRVTLENLPAQWPDQIVELLLDGFEEIWSPTHWQVNLILSSAGPWNNPYPQTEELSVVGSPAWVDGTGDQAVTNPDPGGSGTMIAVLVSQGTTNSPTLTITPPPGVSVTSLVADSNSTFRVNAWTYTNDGNNKTFGASGGADNRCSCILIPLDGLVGSTDVAAAVEGTGPTVAFNSVTTATDDLVLALTTRVSSGVNGAPAGYTVIDNNTAEATAWRSGVFSLAATGGPTTTPPSITWSAATGLKRQYALRFRA